MKILLATAFFTVIFTTSVVGQEDSTKMNKEHHLEEIEIVGNKTLNQRELSISKLPVKARDLPQSITVIDKELIAAQQGSRISDVLKNTNGVALGTTRGTVSETFFARGYSLGANNILRNGLRTSSGSIAEASTLERVEVLKGSSAILYGCVSGGAVINLVTKQPKFKNGGEFSFRTGSYNLFKPIVDLYGPINKKLAYRIVGTYENSESFRKEVKNRRYYINPSLLYNFSEKTSLLVQADYLKYDNTPDFGIGSVNGKIPTRISRDRFFNTPWAYNKVNQATSSATINHAFNDTWSMNVIGGYQIYDRDYFSTERIQADITGKWGRNLTRSRVSERYTNAQVNFTAKLKTLGLSHVLLIGGDAERYLNITDAFQPFKTYDTINILQSDQFTPRMDEPGTNILKTTETPTYRFGYYAQDLINIGKKIKLLTGLRWSYQKVAIGKAMDKSTHIVTYAPGTIKYDKALSPRIGIVYQPINTTSVFASYSNNFVTNTGTDIYGANLKPSIIDQYEVGLKNELIKRRLAVNFNVYRIINNDLAQMAQFDALGNVNSIATIKEFTGQTTSDGFELDIMGNIHTNLQVVAGYSYTFMRYTKTAEVKGSYIKGERLVNVTPHTANGTLFYTFKNTALKGLKAGISAYYTGKRYGGWNNTIGQVYKESRQIPVSAFTTMDFTLGYTFNKVSLLAKISNITNELNYYVHENYSVNPIAPRQFMTTLSYKF